MKTVFLSIIVCLLLPVSALAAPSQTGAASTLVKIGEMAYMDVRDSGTLVLIMAPGERRKGGFFVAYTPEKLEPQRFNLARFRAERSAGLYLEFDSSKNQFVRLLIGERELQIRGSFAVRLGDYRLSVSPQNNGYPYVTLTEKDGDTRSIMGFVGSSLLFNRREKSSSLLEAYRARPESGKDWSADFDLALGGQLLLKGEPFEETKIGLPVDLSNPCLGQDVLMVRMDAAADKGQRENVIEAARRDPNSRHLISLFDFVPLTIESDRIVLFDPSADGRFVRLTHERTQEGRAICIAEGV